MTFSDQFIKILDALCDKIGITVDWTSANVLPYLQNLMQRFVKYETYTSTLWLIIGIAIAILFFFFCTKERKKEYGGDGLLLTIYVSIMIGGFMMSISQAIDIIEVNTIPEKTIMQYIKYINE